MEHINFLGHTYALRLKKNLKVLHQGKKDKEKVWKSLSDLSKYKFHKDYSYRFGGIETVFKNQKSDGFYIEDTVNCSLKYFQSMYYFSCIGVLLLTIMGASFAKNTRTYRKIKIATHTKSNGKKSRIISLFNTSLILFHRAFMSLKYVKIDFRFILYDA